MFIIDRKEKPVLSMGHLLKMVGGMGGCEASSFPYPLPQPSTVYPTLLARPVGSPLLSLRHFPIQSSPEGGATLTGGRFIQGTHLNWGQLDHGAPTLGVCGYSSCTKVCQC
uniref:Uncharacterized protein n=1 Tax=Eutreptiella gymnastica TaxID=73025 RepID=A0A7S1IWG3_9EUGL|mmetsp:Transcript_4882/g.8907  ORF Transcript_4882/g.8907 Transcript_4882/m.8907 type:complete len:111 (+) Transcript_4882:192-524(+)